MCYPCPRTPVTHVSGPHTAAKKVGAAPHRGNACIPTRKQENKKTTKQQNNKSKNNQNVSTL
ncbi:hypothetical protein, partial [Paraburkholderia guartelaensis]